MATVISERPTHATRSEEAPTFVDLFAGCGGLSLGLELAGLFPLYVGEIDDTARQTYLLNRAESYPHLGLPDHQSADIYDVTADPGKLAETASGLRRAALTIAPGGSRGGQSRDVDLVVGGPPCQGYSGIGHRRTFTDLRKVDIPSNHLFEEMVRFVEAVRPRMFIFENVRGLKTGRWTPSGEKGEIWRDVLAAFTGIEGYYVRDAEVLARNYGVPQNRPRVLIAGIRDDAARDAGWQPDPQGVAMGLLPSPTGEYWHPREFLADLIDLDFETKTATTAYPAAAETGAQRWYRTDPSGFVAKLGDPVTEHEYSHHTERIRRKFAYMIANAGEIRPEDRTKKFAQRVIPAEWGPAGPTITATSLPDDYVHFSQPRILTVREWARLQTFPDWYSFAGKRTTGGRRRAGDPGAGQWKREVPKYTQIGNAVPVRLAEAIGAHVRALLMHPHA